MESFNTSTQKNKKIAFFDSGIGGLTVYSKFRALLPNEDCIYFGDLKNLPYGNKTKEQLIGFTRKIFNFFKSKEVKAVVMACNTSSAAAYYTLRQEYDFKIYPIIQSCAGIIARQNISRLGIFATESTINSGVYTEEIKKYSPETEIFPQSCPQWVNIVESETQVENEELIKSSLDNMLKNKPDKIILGCTHYPYLLKTLTKYSDESLYIDPAEYFVEYIKQDLENSDLLNPKTSTPKEEFYVSASPKKFEQSAKMFYDVQNAKETELD